MRTLLLASTLLLFASPPAQSQQQASALPALLESSTSIAVSLDAVAGQAIQRRLVTLRSELLESAAAIPALELELFGGEVLTVNHSRTEAAHGGGFVWSGTVQGMADADVVLAVTGEAVMGSIRTADKLYRIRPAGAGLQWLSQEDESAFASCGTTGPSSESLRVEHNPVAPKTESAANPIIDVLVVYSTAAKDTVGGTNAMTSLINLAITETNEAYDACLVTQQLNLVHTEEMIGYSEPSSFGTILNHLTSTGDGNLDEAHDLRNAHGADAVVMICLNGQYCGIAHLMTNVGPGFQSQAFSVVNHGCATGYYSFGHELGHNFGSHHDPANAGGAAYNYSYGYRTPNSQYRTIMAYSPGTRIKRFSSPSATWQGNTMGNASQDNGRSLNNTGPTVAAWRATVQTGSILQSSALSAGSQGTFSVQHATPFSQVLLGMSLTGGGPTASPFGSASLSAPIRLFATLNTNEGGGASHSTFVPVAAAGLTVWLQAVDLGSGMLGNGIQVTVQ